MYTYRAGVRRHQIADNSLLCCLLFPLSPITTFSRSRVIRGLPRLKSIRFRDVSVGIDCADPTLLGCFGDHSTTEPTTH